MKSLRGLAAGACAAVAAAAFATGVWIEWRGQTRAGPLDLVWIEAASQDRNAAAPDPSQLGLTPGDRLRVVRRSDAGRWGARVLFPPSDSPSEIELPSLESLHTQVLQGANPVWICRADRDLPDFPLQPQGATLAFLPQVQDAPQGWEFLGAAAASAVRAGRPFSLQCKLGSVSGGSGRARVWLDGILAGETAFKLASREEQASIPVTIASPGSHAFRIEALEGAAPGRPREISGALEVLPPPRLRVVGDDNEISRWLETQGFLREKEQKESASPDLVLVTRSLSKGEAESLESLVREGAGAIFFQGDVFSSVSPAGGAVFPEWLPAKMRSLPRTSSSEGTPAVSGVEPPSQDPLPAPPTLPAGELAAPRRESREASVLALMLVLDKSGSMAGEKLDRTIEAAIETAKTLDPKDLLGILAFDREVTELLPLGPAGQSGDLRQKFERLDAGGGTRIFPALQRGAQALAAAPASIRHLILLTDGATEDKVAKDAPYFEFMSEQARKGLTLTAVGIRGGDYDSEFLSNLAVWGKGRFYPVDSDRIPQIFTLEAKRVRAMGSPSPGPSSSGARDELRVRSKDPHPILQGIDWEKPQSAPPLRAMHDMSPQPWSSVPLTGGGNPLFALSHVGQGRVALWAGYGAGPTMAEWMSDARARQFWVQTAEYLRRRDSATGEATLQVRGLDLENRLRSREERLREVGKMSARCGAQMIDDVRDVPALLKRRTLGIVPPSLPWFALAGAAFALLAIIFSTPRQARKSPQG